MGGSAECRNMAQSDFQSYDVLGIPISVVNLETAEKALVRWSGDTRGRYVGVREVPSIMIMHDDPKLKEISRNADMNLPDGMPIVWIGKQRPPRRANMWSRFYGAHAIVEFSKWTEALFFWR